MYNPPIPFLLRRLAIDAVPVGGASVGLVVFGRDESVKSCAGNTFTKDSTATFRSGHHAPLLHEAI